MDPEAASLVGLTTEEAEMLLKSDGENTLPHAKRHSIEKWIQRFIAPIPLMLIAAAVFSFVLGKNFDGWFILALFAVNLGISVWHEWKAENTLQILQNSVSMMVKTLRDGVWSMTDSKMLVVGDVIELTGGSVIPADATVLEANATTINESVLTGESLPIEKMKDDRLMAGSFVASGIVRAVVTATGAKTRFGHTIAKDTSKRKPSILEKDILRISKFLSVMSLSFAALISIVLFIKGDNIFEIIRFDLTLLIAGIPVALPVVMSLIISVGALDLTRRSAIVRRLSALEDFANVDLLLSDKTGTLTQNNIKVHSVELFTDTQPYEVASLAAATTSEADYHTLERAVVTYAETFNNRIKYRALDSVPFDSVRKRSTVLVQTNGGYMRISLGAPEVIKELSQLRPEATEHFDTVLNDAGKRGLKVLALAVRRGDSKELQESDMEILAFFLLSDELRKDAKNVVDFLVEHGVAVKMLTGDNIVVSREVARVLGLKGEVISCRNKDLSILTEKDFHTIGVFSEIFPEDKKRLVDLAEQHHTVAVTGDGINDLPALRSAHVGIAVANAVDALKETADIVLTADGIGIIRDAVIESRKIFARVYSYSIYRISESFRLIIAVAIFGIFLSMPLLTPIQLIILALLNDLPIVSLAVNRVHASHKPATIDVRRRFILSMLYGSVGIVNSILFYFICQYGLHLPWEQIQTLFFLKLTVSGHMLIYVAHTPLRWYRFLPSKPVIVATTVTQVIATLLAALGIFMVGVSPWLVLLVWVWAFFWMQIAELMKYFRNKRAHAHG